MEYITKYLWQYVLEVVGAVLINALFGLSGLTIYCFFVILVHIAYFADYLRKLIRVLHSGNEAKLMIVLKKLKVTEAEINKTTSEIKENTPKEAWESLEKDLKDLQRLG